MIKTNLFAHGETILVFLMKMLQNIEMSKKTQKKKKDLTVCTYVKH